MRPSGRWIHPGSLGSSLSLGSLLSAPEGVGYMRGRWVNPGSLSSLGCSLGVVEFIRVRWVYSGAP